jgi:hypothetical protein
MNQHLKADDEDSHKTKSILENGNRCKRDVKHNEHIQEQTKPVDVGQMRTPFPQSPAVESRLQMQETE